MTNTSNIILTKNIFIPSLILLLTTISATSYSQTIGIKTGINLSHVMVERNGSSSGGIGPEFILYKTGPILGITTEFHVDRNFIFETGLNLSSWGYRNNYEQGSGPPVLTEENYNLWYLNIPVIAKPVFSIGKARAYGAFGPYFSYGAFGSLTTKVTSANPAETDVSNIKWGPEEGVDDFFRPDYGLRFGTGIMFRSFELGFSYNLGLADITPDSDPSSIVHNRVMGVTLGFKFGKQNGSNSSREASRRQRTVSEKTTTEKDQTATTRREDGLQAEKALQEQIRIDSIAGIRLEQEEILRLEKEKTNSLNAVKEKADQLEAVKLLVEKALADSIALARTGVVYRVQFASSTTPKGIYTITIEGNIYKTWEYFYLGAYRSTVGEFKMLKEAVDFREKLRKTGYPQAFVAAFRNNIRDLDPQLLKQRH